MSMITLGRRFVLVGQLGLSCLAIGLQLVGDLDCGFVFKEGKWLSGFEWVCEFGMFHIIMRDN